MTVRPSVKNSNSKTPARGASCGRAYFPTQYPFGPHLDLDASQSELDEHFWYVFLQKPPEHLLPIQGQPLSHGRRPPTKRQPATGQGKTKYHILSKNSAMCPPSRAIVPLSSFHFDVARRRAPRHR